MTVADTVTRPDRPVPGRPVIFDVLADILFELLPRWVRWTLYALVLAAIVAVVVIAVTS